MSSSDRYIRSTAEKKMKNSPTYANYSDSIIDYNHEAKVNENLYLEDNGSLKNALEDMGNSRDKYEPRKKIETGRKLSTKRIKSSRSKGKHEGQSSGKDGMATNDSNVDYTEALSNNSPCQRRHSMSSSDSIISYDYDKEENKSRSKTSQERSFPRSRRHSMTSIDGMVELNKSDNITNSFHEATRQFRGSNFINNDGAKECSLYDLREKGSNARMSKSSRSCKLAEFNYENVGEKSKSLRDIRNISNREHKSRQSSILEFRPRMERRRSMNDMNYQHSKLPNYHNTTLDSNTSTVCLDKKKSRPRACTRRYSMGSIYDSQLEARQSLPENNKTFEDEGKATTGTNEIENNSEHAHQKNIRKDCRPKRRLSTGDLSISDNSNLLNDRRSGPSASTKHNSTGDLSNSAVSFNFNEKKVERMKMLKNHGSKISMVAEDDDFQSRKNFMPSLNTSQKEKVGVDEARQKATTRKSRWSFVSSFAVDPKTRISPVALALSEARQERKERSQQAYDNIFTRRQEILRKTVSPLDNFLATVKGGPEE